MKANQMINERVVFFVMLRAAQSGVLAGIILGAERTIGEAMEVIVMWGISLYSLNP